MKNKIWKTFWSGLIFLSGGFLSGFLALVFSILLQPLFPSPVFLLVLAEELSKFLFIFFLFGKTKLSSTSFLLNCVLLGLGFGGFELLLIFVNLQTTLQEIFFIAPIFLIHAITSLFLGLGVMRSKKGAFQASLLFLSAFLIHLIYNLTIINNFDLHF